MSNRVENGNMGGLDAEAVLVLVESARNGSMAAFDDLVRAFQVPIYNLALRMVNNRADAADLTQEIFVKVYRSIGSFQGKSKFSTWIFMLAMNTCRSGLRKLGRTSGREVVRLDQEVETGEGTVRRELVDPGELPGRTVERNDLFRIVEKVIAGLDDDVRDIIVLRDVQGLAYEDIAEVLACSLGTVKSRIARARIKVKDKLIREGLTCNAMT